MWQHPCVAVVNIHTRISKTNLCTKLLVNKFSFMILNLAHQVWSYQDQNVSGLVSLAVAMWVQHTCRHTDPWGSHVWEHSISHLMDPVEILRHTPHTPHPYKEKKKENIKQYNNSRLSGDQQNTWFVCAEHCQWTALYRQFSTLAVIAQPSSWGLLFLCFYCAQQTVGMTIYNKIVFSVWSIDVTIIYNDI